MLHLGTRHCTYLLACAHDHCYRYLQVVVFNESINAVLTGQEEKQLSAELSAKVAQ